VARVSTFQTRLGTSFLWRAVPAIIVAAIITFSRNHSSVVGLGIFAGYAIVVSLIMFVSIARVPLSGSDRNLGGIQAVVTFISGIIAVTNLGSGLSVLVLVLSIWAALTAALELYAGYRHPDRAVAREWLTIGGFTGLLAIAVSLFPVNDIYAVGLFGAYGAILGVYLIIAGVSLRSDEVSPARPTAEERESQS
jgi:nitrate reductase NapE component